MKGSDSMPKNRDKDGKYIPATGLTKQQTEAIYLIVYDGKKGKEVYDTVGVASSTYYDWYKQDLFKEELEKERLTIRRKLKNKAWKRLEDAIDNASYRDATPYIRMVLEDKEDNFYLNNKAERDENTTTNITIKLIDDSNNDENEE